MESQKDGMFMPVWSSPFGPPPYWMESSERIIIEFETDPEEIRRITPAPLKPAEHNRLLAFVSDNRQTPHSLFYHEAGIVQSVTYEGRPAITIPYLWTSTDTAMLAGRELYGMPKLMCDHDRLEISGNEAFGKLGREGRTMLEMSITIEKKVAPEDMPMSSEYAFMRVIPSPDPDWPTLRQLVWITLEDPKVHSCWAGKGWLRFGWPSSSGLDRLPVNRITNAWYSQHSLTLSAAKILHEEKIKNEFG